MIQPDFADGLMWYVVFVYSAVCHEAAHAWSARKLCDETAYLGGQVSLDPIPHIRREPFGMIAVPILSYLLGGWMIGWASAPYDPLWAARHPRRHAWMALAGPAANLVLLLIAALGIRAGIAWGVFHAPDFLRMNEVASGIGGRGFEFLAGFLSIAFSLNLLLFAFNLLPLPPLDGSSLPLLFLKGPAAEKYQEVIWGAGMRFVGLVVAWQVFGRIYPAVHGAAIQLLYPGLNYS